MELDEIHIPDSKNQSEDLENYGFYIKNGKYHTTEQKGRKPVDIQLSNFTMKSIFNLSNGTSDSHRIIYLQRYTKEKYFIEVFSSEMKPEIFETHLKSKRCTFLGTAYQLKMVFACLMDNEDQADIINLIGWNADYRVYAFADALFTEDGKLYKTDNLGIIKTRERKYYLPAFGYSNLLNEDYKTQRMYKFCPGEADFKTWANLYFQAYGNNGIIGILFTILAIYRDVVFDQVGFFPFLFLFGDAGTGKTQFTEKLLRLFGVDVIGTSLNNATTPGLSRISSQKSNSLVYLKEYTNETESTIQDFILTAYDGAGRTIGMKTTDNKTKTFLIRSAMIFDGNHLPTQKTAILMRMILLNFENSNFTDEQTSAFHKLKEMADSGFGNVLLEILKLRSTIENSFREMYLDVKNKFRRNNHQNIPERMIEHLSLIYTIYQLTYDVLNYPFTGDELFQILVENAESHNLLIKENSSIYVFWEAFSHNVSKGIIQEYKYELSNSKTAHFRIKYIDTFHDEDVILQIRFAEIFPHYVKYCKDNNIKFLDKSSLRNILTSDSNKWFIRSTQKTLKRGQIDKEFGFCYQFSAKRKTEEFAQNQISTCEIDINL